MAWSRSVMMPLVSNMMIVLADISNVVILVLSQLSYLVSPSDLHHSIVQLCMYKLKCVISKAKEMIRHDQIGEILQQRQEKDTRKLNKVTINNIR